MAQHNMKNLTTGSSDLSIFDLPNDILEHMLSFLSSREAVRTCVLSKRWRYLWKFVPALRINEPIEDCYNFLDSFLPAHNDAPINVCDIEFTDREGAPKHDVDTWIFYVISICKVQELRIITWFEDDFFWLGNQALVSTYLRRLELDKVHLEARTVDFSSCPALEDISMIFCTIEAKRITSKSLKRLTTELCEFSGGDTRSHIVVPSLISLKLQDIWGWSPLLEEMPFLEDAYVKLSENCYDYCKYTNSWGCGNEDCMGCSQIDDDKEVSLLLGGLSDATHLELINEHNMIIFERDLKRCPTFRNLRTLILNEWFVAGGLHRLVCILHQSPILEELHLILFGEPEQTGEAEGWNNKMEELLVMKCLKEVKVKCQQKHQWVKILVNTLANFGIPSEKIIIEENS